MMLAPPPVPVDTTKNVVVLDPPAEDKDRPKECAGSRSRREPIPTGTTRILLVILKGLQSPLSVDDMFWVFSQFGVVEKMSSFSKNSKSQLLVQYETQEHAGVALSYLNGRDMHLVPGGPCRLEIVPSFLKVLTFKKLDSRNRDFAALNAEILHAFPAYIPLTAIEQGWKTRDFLWGQYVSGDGWLEPMQDRHERGMIPRVVQMTETGTACGLPQGQVGDCVKLSGVSEADITAEMLFRVASMYGEVVSAKMMAKRKGCALVQYTCKEAASCAIEKLDRAILFGLEWEAVPSKHANALHWDGAGTELQTRMCTVNDVQRPRPVPRNVAGSPSHYLGIYGFDDEELATSILREALKDFNPAEVSSMGDDHLGVAGFETTEEAFIAASCINGKMISGHRVSVYFIQTPDDDDSDAMEGDLRAGWLEDDYRTRTAEYQPGFISRNLVPPRQLTL
ncbi:Polypyrimidine tract-binding protein-like protein 3 [Diplonema papillatum]|nr:Polypyrimidine tract-binding protein-like protein 3 [Diplonema papillatum]